MPDQDKDTLKPSGEGAPEATAAGGEGQPTPVARRSAKTLTNMVKEEIVTKRRKGLSMVVYVLLVFSAVIAALFASVSLMGLVTPTGFSLPNLVSLLIFGGGAVAMWFGKDYLKVEYEYSFTNGVVDIAQVINNRRRKELISIRTREVELVAPLEDPRLHNIEQRPGIKKIRAVLNVDSRIYFAVYRKNDVQYLVYFEPSEEFLRCMRMYNERNVIL